MCIVLGVFSCVEEMCLSVDCEKCPLCVCVCTYRYGYMIDNIILLITGTLHQRQIAELRDKCHPLGSFEEMEQVNIAATPAELYEAVLVDTPLGR